LIFPCTSASQRNIAHFLWIEPPTTENGFQASARFPHGGEHLQGGDDAVAGRVAIKRQDMTGVFTTEEPTLFVEHFDDVAITHRSAYKGYIHLAQRMFKRQIGHQRADHALHRSATCATADDGVKQLIAIVKIAFGVDHLQTVGIAIERDTEIGAVGENRLAQGLGCRGADSIVDIQAVGLHADADHFGTQLMEYSRSDVVGRTMSAVDDDFQAAQIEIMGESALAKYKGTTTHILNTTDAAKSSRGRTDHGLIDTGFDGRLDLVRKLGTLRRKELDPIVIVWIVRSRDDDTGLQTQRAGQIGHRRRRQRADQTDLNAGSRKTGLQGRFKHVAGETGILADQYRRRIADRHATLLKQGFARRVAKAHYEVRRDRCLADPPAHAVGAEIFSAHCSLPCSIAVQTARASRVAATSCTRSISAPFCAASRAAATLAANRSPTGRPVMAPSIFLRETPTRTGRSCPNATVSALKRAKL